MSESALIGIDLGKHTFHLHGQDKSGREVFRKKCSRAHMMQFLPARRAVSWQWRPVRGRTVLLVSWRQLDTRPS